MATPVERVWGVLTDPELLAQLTPLLRQIEVDGDVWTWKMARIPVLSEAISPTFSEVMSFREHEWIGFRHDSRRTEERTGVEGSYDLRPHAEGSEVAIDLQIWVENGEKPLPRKLIITEKWVTGAPQFTALLSDWDLSPQFKEDLFTFVAPDQAEKLEFYPVKR